MVTNYTKALFDLLGWQGGTIHQVAKELGFADTSILLYGKPEATHICMDSDYMLGHSAYSTCSQEWVKERLLPKYRGNKDFWLGYMRQAFLDTI